MLFLSYFQSFFFFNMDSRFIYFLKFFFFLILFLESFCSSTSSEISSNEYFAQCLSKIRAFRNKYYSSEYGAPSYFSDKLEFFGEEKHLGIRIRTLKNINESEILIQIPFNQFFHKGVVKELKPEWDFLNISSSGKMALFMVYEKYINENKTNPTVFQSAIDLYSDSCFNGIFVSKRVLEILKGSSAHFFISQDQKKIKSEYQNYLKPYFHLLGFRISLRQYQWAYCTLYSRAFSLNSSKRRRENDEYMIALAEYFNHKSNSNVLYYFDDNTETYIFQAKRSISSGEELFLSYSVGNNHDLFRSYGFIDENNPNDNVPALIRPSLSDPNWEIKMKILNLLNIKSLNLYAAGFPEIQIRASRMLMLEPVEFSSYNINKCLDTTLKTQFTVENEVALFKFLSRVCGGLLEEYGEVDNAYISKLSNELGLKEVLYIHRNDKMKLRNCIMNLSIPE